MLTYTGNDPLDSSSWTKSPNPVFQRDDANGVHAPGHNGFFKSPDGTPDFGTPVKLGATLASPSGERKKS